MKILRNIIICLSLVFVAGCETYEDYEMEVGPVYPLSGEWLVRFVDLSLPAANDTSGLFVMSTYNTADNSKTQMWMRATSTSATVANAAYVGRFTGKVNCDVAGLSFSGENVANTYMTVAPFHTFTVTNGSVVKDGYTTATGGKSDKITFTITDTRKPGKTITVYGFRRTHWEDDEI